MLYLLSFLFCFGLAAGETVELEPEEKTDADKLRDIVELMKDVEYKLWQERADTTVQIDGKKVEDDLEKLIREVEARGDKPGNKNGKKALDDSHGWHVMVPETEEGCVRAFDPDARDRWSKLVARKRDEMVQVWASEMPLRWKSRISAYFLSLAKAEAVDEKKPTLDEQLKKARRDKK